MVRPIVFLDKELQEIVAGTKSKIVDVLARVETLGGGSRFCLIHIEVEGSKSRSAFAKRMHRYFNRIEERFDLPITPIAVFLSVGGEGLGWLTRNVECFGHTFNHFEFPYIGVPALDGIQYVNTASPVALALSGLMRVPPAERARIKAESLRRLERQRWEPEQRRVLLQCVEAFTVLDAEQTREFEQILQLDDYRRAREMQKTIYDEAEERGEARGELHGRQDCLKLLLEQRFGPLPERSRRKIERMSLEEVDRLFHASLTATDRRTLGL